MNKMTVIQLLNKIANGEEVPSKIEYRNEMFVYDKDNQCYIVENYNEYNDLLMELSDHKGTDLNYEIEILEEPKGIPEKLDMVLLGQCDNWTQKYNKDTKKTENTDIELNPYVIDTIRENTLETQHKLNEIIDYLESKGDE